VRKKKDYGAQKITISLPADLLEWGEQQAKPPPFRGKFSKYIQSLIQQDLDDFRKKQWRTEDRAAALNERVRTKPNNP
jgi:hypothetical protein